MFSVKKSYYLMEASKHKTSKTFLKRRIVMKNLSNVWKMVAKLTAYGAAMAISYFAGEVIGEVLVDRE